MKTLALFLARFVQTFRIGPNSPDSVLCGETVEALAEFFGDGPVPAFDIPLIEELLFNRFLATRLEAHIGERGIFVKRGDNPQGALHPAVNAAIRARGRYAKIMGELAKRHRGAGVCGTGVSPVNHAIETAHPQSLRGAGVLPQQHGQDAHATSRGTGVPPVIQTTAPNGHSVAPTPNLESTGEHPDAPNFMNRAMRRRAEQHAARIAKKNARTMAANGV